MKPLHNFIELFFPRCCAVCGNLLVGDEHEICTQCLLSLPEAYTAASENNYIEHRLQGRIHLTGAIVLLVFRRGNSVQKLLHQIKYRGNEQLAITMGRQLGLRIAESHRFDDVDLLLPVPLHRRKQRRRGYNQSLLLCKGIAQTFPRPIMTDNLMRTRHTPSQTHMNRRERLENMKEVFTVRDAETLKGKHLLLVDDVITTGSTTEACAIPLLSVEGVRLSVAALASAGDV